MRYTSLSSALLATVSALALCLTLSSPVLAQKGKPKPPVKKPAATSAIKTYSWKTVKFQAPFIFQGPENFNGDDACNLFYPNGVKPREDRLRIILATIDPLTAKDLGERGTLLESITTNQVGLSIKPIATKARKFFGQDVIGNVLESDYDGKKRHIEVYIVPLPDGSKMFLSMEYYGPTYAAKYDTLTDSVVKTFATK